MTEAIAATSDDQSLREFRALLAKLGFRCYDDYLASPLWRSIRQRVYEAKGRSCLTCGVERAQDINHERYDRDTLTGKTLKHLSPVCRHCHEVYHRDVLWAPKREQPKGPPSGDLQRRSARPRQPR